MSTTSAPAKSFGARVRAWRVQQSLSLRELAGLLELTAVQMASIERGAADPAVVAQWSRIMAALKSLNFEDAAA